ncbi:MAG: hypothetical protein WD270_05710 [Acetobacterales bacterium]
MKTKPSDHPKRWSPQALANEQIVFDHPLWRRAPAISAASGVAAGVAVLLFADVPWWMPLLVFGVVASVLFRLLRPRFRHPSIEDEI